LPVQTGAPLGARVARCGNGRCERPTSAPRRAQAGWESFREISFYRVKPCYGGPACYPGQENKSGILLPRKRCFCYPKMRIRPKSSDLRAIWSGRRDSNPRPRPWQGRALPLSYTRIREIGGTEAPATARAMPNAARECNSRKRGKIGRQRSETGGRRRNGPKWRRIAPIVEAEHRPVRVPQLQIGRSSAI
jgi:hypothetical protein